MFSPSHTSKVGTLNPFIELLVDQQTAASVSFDTISGDDWHSHQDACVGVGVVLKSWVFTLGGCTFPRNDCVALGQNSSNLPQIRQFVSSPKFGCCMGGFPPSNPEEFCHYQSNVALYAYRKFGTQPSTPYTNQCIIAGTDECRPIGCWRAMGDTHEGYALMALVVIVIWCSATWLTNLSLGGTGI